MKSAFKSNNRTTFIRASHDKLHPYALLSNNIFNDERLSIIDLGILMRLLSYPDSWQLYMTVMQKKSGIGYDQFRNSLNRLIEYGYIKKTKIKGGVHWTIIEDPFEFPDDNN